MTDFKFDNIKDAIEDFKNGKPIIVADDEDRENEGDLICSGQMVTPDIINFMAQEARGLICLAISHEIAEKLDLELYINLKSPRNKSDEITGLKEQMYVCGVSPKPQYKKSAKSNIIQFVDKKSYVDKLKNSIYSHELSEM